MLLKSKSPQDILIQNAYKESVKPWFIMNPESYYFPYQEVRESQADLIRDVVQALEKRGHLIAHAPTGLGKTAATIAPCLKYAMENNKTVLFLTARHTQHIIAIDTVKEIKKKYGLDIMAVDIIGKQQMCLQGAAKIARSSDFAEFCKSLKEKDNCAFFSNTKLSNNSKTVKAQKLLAELKVVSPVHSDQLFSLCRQSELCPYEVSLLMSEGAKLIVADYYYIFHPSIRGNFLSRIKKELKDLIIIVDEGHNLSQRIRDIQTARISNINVERAAAEAKKHGLKETEKNIILVCDALNEIARKLSEDEEFIVDRDEFIAAVEKVTGEDYDGLVAAFEAAALEIISKQHYSYIRSIATFLDMWEGDDEGFSRIISSKKSFKGDNLVTLSYRCLDPSVVSEDIIKESHTTILMSGTLVPTTMYSDILGFPLSTAEKEYESPFPENNKLTLIIPETTTKYSQRSPSQFRRIASICSDVISKVPGNCAVFFPSYRTKDDVETYLKPLLKKRIFSENNRLSKDQKKALLEEFKGFNDKGAVLLGVAAGSFGEGIDLPGDLLNCVIVVGLPLSKPDLETAELIRYYNDKFGRGWDYAYVLPAMQKSFQNAGRCIRTETDKGIIVFLDERYCWPNYLKSFNKDMNLKISLKYQDIITDFFGTSDVEENF